MPNKKNDLPKPNPYLTPISILIAGGLIAAALFINKTASKSKDESVVAGTTDQQNQNQPQPQNQGQVAGINVSSEKREVGLGENPLKGNQDAKVSIIEFSDLQCPGCRYHSTITFPQLEEQYIKTGKVKYAFHNFPLPFHENGQKAAEVLLCAREKGKFWEMHDKLFENQQEWSGTSKPAVNFNSYAKELGITIASCLANDEMSKEVKDDIEYGQKVGVASTPTFFINGRLISGDRVPSFEDFKKIIEEELNQ